MTDRTDDEDESPRKKKKGEGSTEGDSDSWGRGKAGAGAAGGKISHLSTQRLKEVMADWRHLDMAAVIQAVAEFFAELPMRASANLSVAWEQTKTNAKSFALVNWIISFGERAAKEMNLVRSRTAKRDTRGLQNKRQPRGDANPGPQKG